MMAEDDPRLADAPQSPRTGGKGRGLLLATFGMSFVLSLLRLAGPLFMILVYDRVLPSRSEETLVALFFMLVLLVVASGLIDHARRRIIARFGAQFQERIETQIFQRTPREEFLQRGAVKPTSGLDEVDGLRSFFHSGALLAMMDFFWLPMFVAFIFILHPTIGWVLIGGMALLLADVLLRIVFARDLEDEARAATGRIGELKHMLVSSRDVLRTQEMTAPFKARWLQARRQSRDQAITLRDFTGWFDTFSRQSKQLVHYAVLAVGAWFALRGEMTVGAMVACTFVAVRCLSIADSFFEDLPAMRVALQNWRGLKRILEAKTTADDDLYADHTVPERARLSLVNISVRTGLDATPVLRGVSLNIAAGQVVEITGASGAGKTVLAETLLGIWRRSSGCVLYNGMNTARLSEAESTRIFGYVPEAPSFLSVSIEENITRMVPGPDRERVMEVCRLVALHDRILAMPDGYQTRLDRNASGFSRGERHRLALARALYHQPEVLIIDEADDALRGLLRGPLADEMLAKKAKGHLLLVFSRDPLKLAYATARLSLENGKLKLVKPQSAVKAVAPSAQTASANSAPSPTAPVRTAKVSPLIRGGGT